MALDYTGQHGGLLASAFAAGAVFATGILMAVGKFIAAKFFDPRIAELQALLTAERADCERKIEKLEQQVSTLQTLLLLHGPAALRAQLQPIVSEIRADMDDLKGPAE